MAELRIDLDIRDVDGRVISDPDVVLRLARSDAPNASAWKVPFDGQVATHTLKEAPAGSSLLMRVSMSRYHDIGNTVQVRDGLVVPVLTNNRPLTAPRIPAEWKPVFDRWDDLPAAFDGLKTILQKSVKFILGRGTNGMKLTGKDYDGISADDEPRVRAKMAMLNLYSRLAVETPPDEADPWFTHVGELLQATSERIIVVCDEGCFKTVKALSSKGAGGYHKAGASLHRVNFEGVPGVSHVGEMFSVKTAETRANLQFTVTKARRNDAAVFLLDCDMDENGRLLAHTFDLIRHKFTGGTHPIDIHEVLRDRFKTTALGYQLEPWLTPVVEARAFAGGRALKKAGAPRKTRVLERAKDR